jgi:hypothetical protein
MGPALSRRIQTLLDRVRESMAASAVVCCVGDAREVLRSSAGDSGVDAAIDAFLRRLEVPAALASLGAPLWPTLRASLPADLQVLVTLDRKVCLLAVLPKAVDAWFASAQLRSAGQELNALLRDGAPLPRPPESGSPPIPAEALAIEPPPSASREHAPPSDWAPGARGAPRKLPN